MATIDITTQSGAVGNGDLQLQNGAPMDATLRFVTDALNTASPLKLSTSLVQSTSTLKITTNDNPYIDAEDGSGNNRFTVGRAPASQQVNVDFASNPTGSTTAVGAIRTFRDGTNLSEAMTFIEDGSVGIGTTAPVGILDLYKAAAATRLAIRGDAGQNRLISYRTGALQRFGLYVNNTAESGSNVGSDFLVRAYSDAGTLITTPLFIKRSTGFLGVGNVTAPTQQLHVNGSLRIETGGIYDGTNSIGTSGQVLSSTGTSTAWITPSGGGGTPAGTTGAVQFNNAGAFGADSTNFFWDDTNNRLGVGTNSPSATAHFIGSGATSATTSLLVQNSAGLSSLQVNDAGSVFNNGKGAVASNTAFGNNALAANTTGTNNTANGVDALSTNTTGAGITAIGYQALRLSTGGENTAVGNLSLSANTNGVNNTTVGSRTLLQNTTGFNNVAMGNEALRNNISGNQNTAIGRDSLRNNTASNNVAVGFEAGKANTSATGITAIGYQALTLSTGANNTALGFQAGDNITTGAGNVCIGSGAEPLSATASNQFVVGTAAINAGAVTTEANISTQVWNVIINGVARKILLA